MVTESRTKRRWILSVLAAVDGTPEVRLRRGTFPRVRSDRAEDASGKKGFASRLKAATRPLAEAVG
jgi:hypothetical protein